MQAELQNSQGSSKRSLLTNKRRYKKLCKNKPRHQPPGLGNKRPMVGQNKTQQGKWAEDPHTRLDHTNQQMEAQVRIQNKQEGRG